MVENLNDRRPLNRYLLSHSKKCNLSLVEEADLYGEIRYSLVTERFETETDAAMRFLKREIPFPEPYNAVDVEELADFDREIEEIPSWQGLLTIMLFEFFTVKAGEVIDFSAL